MTTLPIQAGETWYTHSGRIVTLHAHARELVGSPRPIGVPDPLENGDLDNYQWGYTANELARLLKDMGEKDRLDLERGQYSAGEAAPPQPPVLLAAGETYWTPSAEQVTLYTSMSGALFGKINDGELVCFQNMDKSPNEAGRSLIPLKAPLEVGREYRHHITGSIVVLREHFSDHSLWSDSIPGAGRYREPNGNLTPNGVRLFHANRTPEVAAATPTPSRKTKRPRKSQLILSECKGPICYDNPEREHVRVHRGEHLQVFEGR